MENNQVLDSDLIDGNVSYNENIISLPRFIVLSVATFGVYEVWWIYKTWKYFRDKDGSEILPVWRAIFSVVFLWPLLNRILDLARKHGYEKSYSTPGIVIFYIIINLMAQLPDPLWLVSILGVACFIQPVQAFNFAVERSEPGIVRERDSFASRQIALILVGAVCWILFLMSLFLES